LPFIGNQPALSYTSFAKQDFTTSATTSYTLDNPVANANELALFINFVRQEPTTAYSASGTSLTLTSATSASDDMYCVFLGKAVQTVNPPNGSVGTAQIADGSITEAKFSSGVSTITEADQWRINADLTTSSATGFFTANWERVDTDGFGKIGTGLSESSGVFSFPSTGIYLIQYDMMAYGNGGARPYFGVGILTTVNNSSYDYASMSYSSSYTNGAYGTMSGRFQFNVTDVSTHKFKMGFDKEANSLIFENNSTRNSSNVTITRLGDSV
jgi:hypothetical protein